MNFLKKFYDSEKTGKILNNILFSWYLISPIFWLQDATLSFDLKVTYAVITYLIDIVMFRVIAFGYKNQNLMDYAISLMMVFWFIYSTLRDYTESGYTIFYKSLYVSIDVVSFLFFLDTFLNFIFSSKFLTNMFEEKLKKIGKYLRGITIIAGVIFLFNLLKGAR